jgi:hypothetical protein
LSEADNRRIIDNTKFEVLFIKVPGKPMEVRIIQFTPSFNYLQSKNFNLSNLSFKDYTKEFKGDFMMFDFDNNFKAGYHFANDGIKTIKLQTKYPKRVNVKNDDQPGLAASNSSSSENDGTICDNAIEISPNCMYMVTTEYEIVCSNGWNPNEGFNPDFCRVVIFYVYCELLYCDPPPPSDDPFENCINQGHTEAECVCSLYGIGCGGGEEEGGGEEGSCNMSAAEATAVINAITTETTNIVSSSELGVESMPDANGIIKAPKPSTGGGYTLHILPGYDPHWEASYSGTVYKDENIPNDKWKWETFAYSAFPQTEGSIPPCFSVSMTASGQSVTIDSDKLHATGAGNYSCIVTISCLGGPTVASFNGQYSCTFSSN